MASLGYEVADIVQGIWLAMFGTHVVPEDPAGFGGRRARAWTGIVHISGAWEGSLALQCAEPLVRRVTATTLGLPEERVSLDHQHQALGELARMIGETFKTLLPEPCAVAKVETAVGPDFQLQLPDAAQVLQVVLRADDQVFGVTVFQRLPQVTAR